ncbi:MAG: dihydropteroate synthase [Desulfobacterales bacterium]|nr:dihydropteroate synthase [Desulfobacterales bacterium]
MVNDISALRCDPAVAAVAAEFGVPVLPDAHAGRAADHAGRPAL